MWLLEAAISLKTREVVKANTVCVGGDGAHP